MLLEPPINELVNKAGNPYKLAVLVGKRANHLDKELTEQQKEERRPVTRAVDEFYDGRVVEKKEN